MSYTIPPVRVFLGWLLLNRPCDGPGHCGGQHRSMCYMAFWGNFDTKIRPGLYNNIKTQAIQTCNIPQINRLQWSLICAQTSFYHLLTARAHGLHRNKNMAKTAFFDDISSVWRDFKNEEVQVISMREVPSTNKERFRTYCFNIIDLPGYQRRFSPKYTSRENSPFVRLPSLGGSQRQ